MSASSGSEPSVSRLVTEISRLFSRDFSARVRDYDLTHTQWQALAVLSRQEGINQAELANLLQVQPISLGRLIDRMEAAGWVAPPAPNDRRAILLLTSGRADLDKMTAAARSPASSPATIPTSGSSSV
jgi:DNA-binding MarR family transcriptional regulator